MAWQVLNAINDGDIDTLIRISMNVRGVTRVVLLLCANTICAFSVSHRNSSHGTRTSREFCRGLTYVTIAIRSSLSAMADRTAAQRRCSL